MITIDQTLLHYHILEKSGQESTGEVYLAEDTLHGRRVLLKVLPEAVRKNPERLRQIRTEVEAAMELNHPNIVKMYSFEEAEVEGEEYPVAFVVMEYVEGKELSVLMSWKGLTLDQFFNCFIPLSDALCYAHSLGVTHRDLNPDHILITREGIPKLLDFGLASITRPETRIINNNPTSTRFVDVLKNMTQNGTIIGAPAYMSPEQVEGEATDTRTDIFSFGVMLYEAITGRRPFQGKNHLALITNIVKQDPTPATALKTGMPFLLGRMIANCIRKDKRRRFQAMMEVRRELEDVRLDVVGGRLLMEMPDTHVQFEKPVTLHAWQQPRILIGAAAFLFLFGVMVAWIVGALWGEASEPHARKFQLPLDMTTASVAGDTPGGESFDPSISPDGAKIVYTYQGLLWIRDLARLKPQALGNTDGGEMAFWSPGGDSLGYFAISDSSGKSALRIVPVDGGAGITFCPLPDDVTPGGGTWSRRGGIVLSLGSGSLRGTLFRVSAPGESLQVVEAPDPNKGELGLIHPQFLPDGKTLVYTVTRTDRSGNLVARQGDRRTLLLHNPGEMLVHPAYSSTGHLIYQRGLTARELWAAPFDASGPEITGTPFLIAGHGADPSVSSDGTLVYHAAPAHGSDQLVWVDRQGRITAAIGQPQERIGNPVLSPDGSRIAVTGREQGNFDIWIHDLTRGTKTRLTHDPAYDFLPVWSPSGDRIAYDSVRGVSADIFLRNVDGSGDTTLVTSPRSDWLSAWSQDGRYLTFDAEGLKTRRDLWYIPMDGSGPPTPFLRTPAQEFYPRLSPDSKYMAYQSNESGRFEIYLRSFPDGKDKWAVSVDGGMAPRWSRDGKELYYVQDNVLMAVPVHTSPEVQLGWPEALFDGTAAGVRLLGEYQEAAYDVAADDRRFVAVQGRKASTTITLVENWYEEFRRGDE